MLHYQIKGQGPAVFLLHGSLEDGQIWEALVDKLSRQYRCIQIDFPGCGKNNQVEFPERLENLASDLEELRQNLHLDDFNIIGHSMGVYIGLAWLKLARVTPKAFVCVNGNVYQDSPERLVERKRSISLVSRHKEAYIKMAIKGLFLPEQLQGFASDIEQLTYRALSSPKTAVIRSIEAMSIREDHQQTLKAYQGRKHIIAGTKDPLFPLSLSELMAQQTQAILNTYTGSHMGWLEAPELILRVLGSERIPSASD